MHIEYLFLKDNFKEMEEFSTGSLQKVPCKEQYLSYKLLLSNHFSNLFEKDCIKDVIMLFN